MAFIFIVLFIIFPLLYMTAQGEVFIIFGPTMLIGFACFCISLSIKSRKQDSEWQKEIDEIEKW